MARLNPIVHKVDRICNKILWKLAGKALGLYCTMGRTTKDDYKQYNDAVRRERNRPLG